MPISFFSFSYLNLTTAGLYFFNAFIEAFKKWRRPFCQKMVLSLSYARAAIKRRSVPSTDEVLHLILHGFSSDKATLLNFHFNAETGHSRSGVKTPPPLQSWRLCGTLQYRVELEWSGPQKWYQMSWAGCSGVWQTPILASQFLSIFSSGMRNKN